MKYGYRTPNIKKSIKSRITGKVKRNINKAVNPLYGKKGMGYLNNPQKAIYNKIYNKTTTNLYEKSTSNINKSNKYETINNNETKKDDIILFIIKVIYFAIIIAIIVPFFWLIFKVFHL